MVRPYSLRVIGLANDELLFRRFDRRDADILVAVLAGKWSRVLNLEFRLSRANFHLS